MNDVHIPPDDLEPIVNRLKRARGQLDGVLRMLTEDRDCVEVATQLSAVSKAIDRAGFAMIASGLNECIRQGKSGETTKEQLEKLFLSLA
jgi:DNA-binding FrmR family transcriptional regulator